ncbi:MAG TPA: extracellular solute-binding protein [Patescibacteria group bacterium]|nr:extracellular solute-binding protein [Patescibacteria group bacterium]
MTDPKDPTLPQEAPTPSGGIGLAESVFPAPGQENPPEPPTPQETSLPGTDTIVVPPADTAAPPPPPANPFIPAIEGAGNSAPPPKGKSPIVRLLLLLGGIVVLVFVVQLVFKMLSGGKVIPSKEVTITYWGLWENDALFRQFIADFESTHPKIKVQYTQQSPKQYRERLQSAINRGEGPDVFRFHNTWLPMLRTQLATVPVTVMTPDEFGSTFFPVANNDLVAGSSIFGIPLMFDGLGLYINDELFATAGVTPPTTWTDVINLIPRLTVKNGTAIVTSAIALGTANNVEHFSDILAVMFLQNGANLKNPIGKEAEGTLIFYRKFADPSDPLYTWSDGMDNSVGAFAAGRVAMILAPSWRAHEIAQIAPSLRFHIAPIPQLQGNSVTWASYWVEGVSSKSTYQEASWEFITYLTGKEGAAKLFSTTASSSRLFGEPYARVDLASTITEDPYLGAYVKQAPNARSFPLASRTFDNGINDKLIQYLTDGVNGMINGSAPTQVLTTVSQGFRQVLGTYGISSDDSPQTTPAQ